MRDTIIRDIGTYERKLDVGDIQITFFLEGNEGPFYPPPQERTRRNNDQPTGKIKRITKSKKQLMTELKEMRGFSISCHHSENEIHEITLD